MKPYYNSQARWDALELEAAKWERTPFRHRWAIPGKGVDCVNLVQELLAETSYWKRQDLPDYPEDFGSHSDSSVLLEAFRKLPAFKRAFAEISLEEVEPCLRPRFILPGDVVSVLIGRVEHHSGIALPDGSLFHVFRGGQGAGRLPINSPKYLPRLTTIFRLSA